MISTIDGRSIVLSTTRAFNLDAVDEVSVEGWKPCLAAGRERIAGVGGIGVTDECYDSSTGVRQTAEPRPTYPPLHLPFDFHFPTSIFAPLPLNSRLDSSLVQHEQVKTTWLVRKESRCVGH